MYEKEILRYSKKDRINCIHSRLAYLGLTKDTIKKVLDADEDVIRLLIVDGNDIMLGNLGTLKIRYRSSQEEHEGHNPFTMEKIIIPASEEYNMVGFKPNITLREELKEKTYGNAIMRKKRQNIDSYDDDFDDEDEVESYGA